MSVRVYVGGLSYQAREDDIKDLFRKFGKPHDISLKKGFAFVEFDDDRDADDACYELNGKKFMGERVIIERAKGVPHGRDKDRWGGDDRRRGRSPPRRFDRDRRMGGPAWLDKYGPPTRTNHRLIVQNLSSTISWQDLKDYMRKAGEVTYADVNKERRNEGVVEFRDYRDLEKAIEKLDDTELKGRRIKLVEEQRKRTRSQSHSRSRSRSRSRGRKTKRTKSRSRSRSRSKSKSRARSKSVLDHKSTSRYSRSGTRSRSRSKEYKRKNDKYEDGRSKEKWETLENEKIKKEEESDTGQKTSPDGGNIKLEAMDVDRDHSNLNGKYRMIHIDHSMKLRPA